MAAISTARSLFLTVSPSPQRRDHLCSHFLPPIRFLCLRDLPPTLQSKPPSSRLARRLCSVKAARSNLIKVIETTWRIGKDSVDAGTNLIPDSIPRPIARIGITGVLAAATLFLFNSFLSTAFFVLALMALIYFLYIFINTDEVPSGRGGDPLREHETLEEARRIMDKYK